MWHKVANIILRHRVVMLSILAIITLFFGYYATKVTLQYEFASLLPSNDPTLIEYNAFKKDFGQDPGFAICPHPQKNSSASGAQTRTATLRPRRASTARSDGNCPAATQAARSE